MHLLTKPIHAELLRRGKLESVMDLPPVVKFFTPDAACTWLIASMLDDGDTLFGLCDLGVGFPELGTVSLSELKTVRGRLRIPVERDLHITFDQSLRVYVEKANAARHITA
jgi:hypothetical protein